VHVYKDAIFDLHSTEYSSEGAESATILLKNVQPNLPLLLSDQPSLTQAGTRDHPLSERLSGSFACARSSERLRVLATSKAPRIPSANGLPRSANGRSGPRAPLGLSLPRLMEGVSHPRPHRCEAPPRSRTAEPTDPRSRRRTPKTSPGPSPNMTRVAGARSLVRSFRDPRARSLTPQERCS
jgi:hypothetical protein